MSEHLEGQPLRVGDVRVCGGLATYATRVQVWSGKDWILVRGILAVTWEASADQALPALRLSIEGAAVDFLTPRERIGLDLLRDLLG